MTMLESHRVYIGACGWQHPQWCEQFYPEDLPGDWQLAYYGNEFPLVLVREQEWQQAGDVANWLEDTEDAPLFICELPLQQCHHDVLEKAEDYLEKITVLGKRCLGIICRVNNEISQADLVALLEKCNTVASTCLETEQAGSPALPGILHEQSVNVVWDKVDEPRDVDGPLVVAKVSSDKLDLKSLRQVLDSLLQFSDEKHTVVLLVDGDAPDLELVRQAKMLLELM